MFVLRMILCLSSITCLCFNANAVHGQAYPHKTIRIVTTEPASGNDFIARLIAQGISVPLGKQVIVDNRSGLIVPGDTVAKSSPDGYTLLLSSSTLWLVSFFQDKVPFDAVRDFSPITLASTSPNVLVVQPTLPVKSVKELIALAKSRPKELNVAVVAPGGSIHLSAELFRTMTGIEVVGVPYKGTAQGINAVIGAEVQMMFPPAPSVAPHIESGRLRALAVTSSRQSALAPGLPTIAASVPGYDAGTITGIWAPAHTPELIIKLLNQEIVRFLAQADVREKFLKAGVDVVGNSPVEFATTMKSDMLKWSKLIKEAGIRIN